MSCEWCAKKQRVAVACRAMMDRRSAICTERNIGLTKLYNEMDAGQHADLAALQLELDRAVVACYGWPESIAQDDAELVRRLTERNREITLGLRTYDPFGDCRCGAPYAVNAVVV